MRTKANQAIMLLVIVLAVSVRSEIPEAAQNPVCPAAGTITLEVEALQSNVEFDHSGFWWSEETDDSVGLFVKNADDENPFTLSMFDPLIQQKVEFTCQGTEGFEFVALVRHILVVKNPADSKYYLCSTLIAQSFELNIVQLAVPSSNRIANPNRFKPFYYVDSGELLVVAVGTDSQTSIQLYTVPDSIGASAPALAPESFGNIIGKSLDDFLGTNQFIFDKALNQITYYSSSSWTTPGVSIIPAGLIWEVAVLSDNFVIIMQMGDDMEMGIIKFTPAFDTVLIDDATLIDQETAYVHQTDGISNFITYAGDVFYWFNIDYDVNPRSEFLTGGEITTAGIDSIALSGNKLTILYDGQISYYRMVGQAPFSDASSSATVEHIMTKTFTTSIEEDGAYKFGLECLCKGVRKFVCYSSTLNCLIIKKADEECGRQDVPVPPQPQGP